MKRHALLLGILLLSGCQNNESLNNHTSKANFPEDSFPFEKVVDKYGVIENFNRFEDFKSNTEKGAKDNLMIVQYTPEGDYIVHKLEYDGSAIKSTIDTSRNASEPGGIYHNMCTSIEVADSKEATEYILKGCKKAKSNTILVQSKP